MQIAWRTYSNSRLWKLPIQVDFHLFRKPSCSILLVYPVECTISPIESTSLFLWIVWTHSSFIHISSGTYTNSLLCRCLIKEKPEVLIQELDGEHYIRSNGMEASIQDIKLYLRYNRERTNFLITIELFLSFIALAFGLSTERRVVHFFSTLGFLLHLVQFLTRNAPVKSVQRLVRIYCIM